MTLHKIKDYLEESPGENEISKQWDQNDLSNSLIDINEILKSKDWTSEVNHALKSSDNVEYWNGKQAAEKLGIEFWDIIWTKLKQNPLDSIAWYDVTTYANEKNVDEIVDFAKNELPLVELGSGPKDSMGLGDDYQKHSSLDSVITFLENYPKKGEKLILVGLDSPVTRNRNMTLRTLQSWTSRNWNEEIRTKLNKLKEIEPNANTKSDLVKLLNGEKIE